MGSTPIYAIPYVEPADQLNAFPAADKAQAERLDAVIKGAGYTDYPNSTTPSWFTANATNITLTGAQARRWGPFFYLYLALTFKVASAAPPASGDIANYQLGTLTAGFEPYQQVPLAAVGTGRVVAGYAAGTSIGIGAIAGTSALAVGETLALAGTYLLLNP